MDATMRTGDITVLDENSGNNIELKQPCPEFIFLKFVSWVWVQNYEGFYFVVFKSKGLRFQF